ncbi:MAG TPA: hypothetical protein VHR47_04290 [Bacillota bacterium]|jgi:hypothetical protein|nr:hypothetical protein [Bacillota bacterium]
MRHWRWLLLGLSAIIILFVAITVQKPVHLPNKNRKIGPADPTRIIVKDVALSLVDQKNVVRWKLKIKEAKEFSGGMTFSNIKGSYFPDQGEPFVLSAQTGQINRDMNELILSSDVALSQDNYHIKGHQLIWNAKDKGFQMNGGVVLESETLHGEGEHLITDASLKHIRLEGRSLWRTKANLPKGGQKH